MHKTSVFSKNFSKLDQQNCKEKLKNCCLTKPTENPFQKHREKGENADNQHFFLFSQCFPAITKQISNFQSYSICRLNMLSIWTSLKFCHLVRSYVQAEAIFKKFLKKDKMGVAILNIYEN